jgi:hypothetical protein
MGFSCIKFSRVLLGLLDPVERSREVKPARNRILLQSWRQKISWARVSETTMLWIMLYVVTCFANPVTVFYCTKFALYRFRKAFGIFVGLDKGNELLLRIPAADSTCSFFKESIRT